MSHDLYDGRDWQPLHGNPAPGNLTQIQLTANDFHSLARECDLQRSQLAGIRRDVDAGALWTGSAAEEVRKKLHGLPDELGKLVASYRAAGDALSDYVQRLRPIQARAVEALTEATRAVAALGQTLPALDAQRRQVGYATSSAEAAASRVAAVPAGKPVDAGLSSAQADTQRTLSAAQSTLQSLSAEATAWQAKLDAARAEAREVERSADQAGRATAEALKHASRLGIQNDNSIWGKVKRFARHHSTVLKVIVMALAIATIFLGGWLFLVVCLVILAIDVTLWQAGAGDLSNVILDCLPLAGPLLKGLAQGARLLNGPLGRLAAQGGAIATRGAGRASTAATAADNALAEAVVARQAVQRAVGEAVTHGRATVSAVAAQAGHLGSALDSAASGVYQSTMKVVSTSPEALARASQALLDSQHAVSAAMASAAAAGTAARGSAAAVGAAVGAAGHGLNAGRVAIVNVGIARVVGAAGHAEQAAGVVLRTIGTHGPAVVSAVAHGMEAAGHGAQHLDDLANAIGTNFAAPVGLVVDVVTGKFNWDTWSTDVDRGDASTVDDVTTGGWAAPVRGIREGVRP